MSSKPIIIVTPPYLENSNGIKSLHKICHTINQVGGDARLVFLYNGIKCGGVEQTNPKLNTPCLSEDDRNMMQTEIVVYPEIISGNPACASKIVRYLGNKDGLLTGNKMNAKPSNFLLSHSKVIEPKAHCVLFNAEFNPVFNDIGTEDAKHRHLDATYIGKGSMHGNCYVMTQTLLIERLWPRGHEQLAYLLKNTRYFYTWDSWTATNIESILCGSMPIFMRYDPWTEEELDGSELGKIPRLGVHHSQSDLNKFNDERMKLIGRIAELNATWNERVRGFVDQVQVHWG